MVQLAFPEGRALAVQRANEASSSSPIYGAHFKRAAALMEGRGLLTTTRGHRHSKRYRAPSTICPTPLYWEQARQSQEDGWKALTLEDHREVVLVGKDKDGRQVLPPQDWLQQAEADIRRINEHLKAAPLAVAGYEVLPPRDMTNKLAITLTTPHHRTVRRIFRGSIDAFGRLYDGFWETMRREDRQLLTLNGSPAVIADYAQLHVRLAYARDGKDPPAGDLYDLTGEDHKRPDWPALRTGRKRMLAAMLLKNGALKNWIGGTPKEQAALRGCFPRDTKPRDVAAAIRARHNSISDWFERGRGAELQRVESDILVAVMLHLIDLGIPACLPLHDGLIVARPDGELARRVMLEEARRIAGVDIPVEVSEVSNGTGHGELDDDGLLFDAGVGDDF